MNFTREQLMAGANSVMAERVNLDPYSQGLNGYVVKEPTETNGWLVYYNGQSYWSMDEAKILQRASVLVCLGKEPV